MATEQPRDLRSATSAQPANPHNSGSIVGSYSDLFKDIQAEWNKAEASIKRGEQIALDLSIPAVTELRYAGRRIVDALCEANTGGDEVKIVALLEDARFCCHRAQHDAIDAAMAKIGIDLDDLTSRLGFDAVIAAYPTFNDFYADFVISREKIAASREKRDDRKAIYDSISEVDLPDLAHRYERIMAVRPIAKQNALKRRLGGMNGAALLVIALIGLLFAGLAVD